MNIRSGALLFIAIVLLAPQSAGGQDTERTAREHKLEKMIRDLTAHINSLEARLDDNDRKASERESSQVRQLEQLVQRLLERVDTLEGRSAQELPPGHANVEWGGRTTGSADLDLGERVAKLEERANRHPNPLDVYWEEGLRLESEDGDFKFKIGGRIMAEGAIFNAGNQIERDTGDLDSGVEFRRVRLFILGTIYDNVDFEAEFDFADGDSDFKDVFVALRGIPYVGSFRVGHFKEPFGLEQITSSKYGPVFTPAYLPDSPQARHR